MGLGGKEGWGFCKVSATRLVHFLHFSSSLCPSCLPSLPKPSGPHPRLAVSLCPLPPSPLLFLCVWFLPFLPLGFQSRWEKGGRVGPVAQREGSRDRAGQWGGPPSAPDSAHQEETLAWCRPGKGLGAWKGLLCCVPPGDVH